MWIKRNFSSHTQPRQGRSAFTLVELMIVIGVIALLITISVAAFANFIMTSKEKATASTINKIHKILQQRKEAFDRLSFKDAAKSLAQRVSDPEFNSRAAEVIVRKQRLQLAFPQRVEERSLFNGIKYDSYFSGASRPNYESAALLYLAIMDGETFGAPQVDDDAFTAAEIVSISIMATDINNNPVSTDLKYFVDAWGQPLRFYRWPTGMIRPNPTGSIDPTRPYSTLLAPSLPPVQNLTGFDPLSRDPDDPTQFLWIYYDGLSNADKAGFASKYGIYFTPSTFHTPLLVSSGPDRSLGLYEPNYASNAMNTLAVPLDLNPPTSTSPLQDNITNLNQRNKGN